MADVQKYSLITELNKADEKFQGSPALRGMSGMTFTKYVNAMRTTMNTSQQKQYLTLRNPNFPYVFTGMENVAGKHSSGYKKAKSNLEVYAKVSKFKNELKSPEVYMLFVYDKKADKYDVIMRKPVEDHLSENFGFEYDNTMIDSLKIGDTIKNDTVLYKSRSYDDVMNFGYGMNVTMMYTLDPYTAEDAAIVSESLARSMVSTETEYVTIGLNNNDYLLNLYGNSEHYRVLPEIGSILNSGYICGIRRQYNSQLLYDFTEKSLREMHTGDDIKRVDVGTVILDYTIYGNLDSDVKRTPFNEQLLDILESQNQYYREVHFVCDKIMKSGSAFSNDIEYWYKRSGEFLDTQKKWKEGDSAFSNMVIEVEIKEPRGLSNGQKLAGRFGNKSVVSKIVPDIYMPITEDGRRVHLMLSLLGIINRTTAFPLYETFINCASWKLRKLMVKMTRKEQEHALFGYLARLNVAYANKMREIYESYDDVGKDEFMHDTIYDGIYVDQNDINEDTPIFYKIQELLRAYGNTWLKPDKVYIRNRDTGRDQLMLATAWVGEQYILKLKQSDRRGASIRSTGAVDITSLPTRNNKSKAHLERTSSTAIRFGEFESLNFSIGLLPEDIALFHAFYRTSPKARKSLTELMFSNDPDKIMELPSTFTSQVASIFNVRAKSLGFRISFIDDDNIIRGTSTDDELYEWIIDGQSYMCTEYQAKVVELIKRTEKEVEGNLAMIETKELCDEVNTLLRRRDLIPLDVSVYDENGDIDLSVIA